MGKNLAKALVLVLALCAIVDGIGMFPSLGPRGWVLIVVIATPLCALAFAYSKVILAMLHQPARKEENANDPKETSCSRT
jgi:hypothetical protein